MWERLSKGKWKIIPGQQSVSLLMTPTVSERCFMLHFVKYSLWLLFRTTETPPHQQCAVLLTTTYLLWDIITLFINMENSNSGQVLYGLSANRTINNPGLNHLYTWHWSMVCKPKPTEVNSLERNLEKKSLPLLQALGCLTPSTPSPLSLTHLSPMKHPTKVC